MLSCMFVTPIMALIFMTFTTEKWKKKNWPQTQLNSRLIFDAKIQKWEYKLFNDFLSWVTVTIHASQLCYLSILFSLADILASERW